MTTVARQRKGEQMNDFARRVIEQMNKYGFTAPDMTVTEFVEDILLTISKTESVECEDCISREAACQKMMEMYKEDCEMFGVEIPECFDGHRAVRALMELPSVTPKRKTGKWIVRDDSYSEFVECDQCGHTQDYSSNYCPNCGAMNSKSLKAAEIGK